jgi:hypothetical protein
MLKNTCLFSSTCLHSWDRCRNSDFESRTDDGDGSNRPGTTLDVGCGCGRKSNSTGHPAKAITFIRKASSGVHGWSAASHPKQTKDGALQKAHAGLVQLWLEHGRLTLR